MLGPFKDILIVRNMEYTLYIRCVFCYVVFFLNVIVLKYSSTHSFSFCPMIVYLT